MIWFVSRRFLTHLEQEVAYWRLLHQHERQRAELLQDRLLARHGVAPITMPLIEDRLPVEPMDPAALLREAQMNADLLMSGAG